MKHWDTWHFLWYRYEPSLLSKSTAVRQAPIRAVGVLIWHNVSTGGDYSPNSGASRKPKKAIFSRLYWLCRKSPATPCRNYEGAADFCFPLAPSPLRVPRGPLVSVSPSHGALMETGRAVDGDKRVMRKMQSSYRTYLAGST